MALAAAGAMTSVHCIATVRDAFDSGLSLLVSTLFAHFGINSRPSKGKSKGEHQQHCLT
jgi:hypothetical protein